MPADPDRDGPARRPTSTPRGAAFAGVSPYVLLGRGQDYAWSATSAGQDIIDTFAEKLCEPDGVARPTSHSTHYLYKGECRPMETLDRGSTTSRRTRPTRRRPRPYTLTGPAHRARHRRTSAAPSTASRSRSPSQRSTYFHEADSARAFSRPQPPSKVQNAQDFQQVDVQDQLHLQLVLRRRPRHRLLQLRRQPGARRRAPTPTSRPGAPASTTGRASTRPPQDRRRTRPSTSTRRSINQDYITSWNNKQAPGFDAADDKLRLRADLPLATRSTSGSSQRHRGRAAR